MKLRLGLLSLLVFFVIVPGQPHFAQGDCPSCGMPPAVMYPMPAMEMPPPPPPPPVPAGPVSHPDVPAPIVTLKAKVPACAETGRNLEYRILVENASPAAAHNVIVRNKVPANARFVSASPKPHSTTPELQWHLGTLQGHACLEITLVLRPTDRCDITNCFIVTFEHGICLTTRLTGSPPPEVVPVPPMTEPVPTKEPIKKEPAKEPKGKLKLNVIGPTQKGIGETARYVFTVSNEGPGRLKNVLVDSEFPDKLTFISASDKGEHLEGKVAWVVGTLEPGTSRTLEMALKTKETGKWCVKSRALADGGVATGVVDVCTNFVGISAMLLEMYDRADPINVGGSTSYVISALNQGFVPVTNLQMRAVLPAGMDLASASGPVKYQVQGKTITFLPLATLAPGAKADYEVFAKALAAGEMRFKLEMTADQLKEGGPVHEEESTMVYDEEAAPVRLQSQTRQRTRRTIVLDGR